MSTYNTPQAYHTSQKDAEYAGEQIKQYLLMLHHDIERVVDGREDVEILEREKVYLKVHLPTWLGIIMHRLESLEQSTHGGVASDSLAQAIVLVELLQNEREADERRLESRLEREKEREKDNPVPDWMMNRQNRYQP